MFHCSSHSFLSSQDKHGHRHTHSIDFCTFHKKKHCTIYRCRARSSSGTCDPRHGAIVLAKFSEDTKSGSSETWTCLQVEKTKIAQEMANRFNNTTRHLQMIKGDKLSAGQGHQHLDFEMPQTSKLECVSTFDRRRKKEEHFIIVNEFSKFQKFICSAGFQDGSSKKCKSVKKSKSAYFNFSSADNIDEIKHNISRNRSNSESDAGRMQCITTDKASGGDVLNYCGNCGQWNNKPTKQLTSDLPPHQHLHAFVHYFFCQSDGQMAIDCLEGEYDESDGYTLTVPVIHSVSKRFGMHDCGQEGIRRVIENHVCNDLCKHLNQMSVIPTDNNTPHVRNGKCFLPHEPHPQDRPTSQSVSVDFCCQNSSYAKPPPYSSRVPAGHAQCVVSPMENSASQFGLHYSNDFQSCIDLNMLPSYTMCVSPSHSQMRLNS